VIGFGVAMSESDWDGCTDPAPMLEFVDGRLSDRKVRVLVTGCARQVWHLLTRKERKNLEASERYADGSITLAELKRAWKLPAGTFEAGVDAVVPDAYRPLVGYAARRDSGSEAEWREAQCRVVREVVGNPFRPVTLDPAWRTAETLGLARAGYDERAFDRLPILADALEECGCTDAQVLGHLREASAVHVRGCWAVDLILGKT
jgi:hypothetical protein